MAKEITFDYSCGHGKGKTNISTYRRLMKRHGHILCDKCALALIPDKPPVVKERAIT